MPEPGMPPTLHFVAPFGKESLPVNVGLLLAGPAKRARMVLSAALVKRVMGLLSAGPAKRARVVLSAALVKMARVLLPQRMRMFLNSLPLPEQSGPAASMQAEPQAAGPAAKWAPGTGPDKPGRVQILAVPPGRCAKRSPAVKGGGTVAARVVAPPCARLRAAVDGSHLPP